MARYQGHDSLVNARRPAFAQFVGRLPSPQFRRIVRRYKGNRRVRSFSCWDQFLCMTFAQRLSLFPWARFSRDRNAVKLHTLLDLHENPFLKFACETADCAGVSP